MASKDEHKKEPERHWRALPSQGIRFMIVAFVISLLFHLFSGIKLGNTKHPPRFADLNNKNSVKIRIVETPKLKKEPPTPSPENDVLPKILETPQTKTERPDESSYAGNVDHKAEKEMKLPDNRHREKAADPGQKGSPTPPQKPSPQKQVAQEARPAQQGAKNNPKSDLGKLKFDAYNNKPRNQYEAMLPTNMADLPGQLTAGYQDYIDDKIEEGDRIDISTTEYRYIGYFTTMRKAIELVWSYPGEASRRGMEGEVGLEFAIGKDGRASGVKVIKSSGYDVLDQAIVEAIRLASPFSPLPDGFGKSRILVTGSFRYILTSYGSH